MRLWDIAARMGADVEVVAEACSARACVAGPLKTVQIQFSTAATRTGIHSPLIASEQI